MSDDQKFEKRYSRAEQALEEFFALRAGKDGSPVTFADFVARHPDLATELRELYGLCEEVDQALEVGQEAVVAQQAETRRMLAAVNSSVTFEQRYAVEAEVGKGGMGAVFRVIDRSLDRPLAMKVILGQATATRSGKTPPIAPRQLRRFLNEAKITGQLDHPGIVPVHEVGVDDQGRAYFTMKLVKGRTLGEVFDRQARGDAEWPRPRVLSTLQRVCEAMAYAHERSVIHRDLKPANVMVGDFGEVYVMDWGLARRMDDAAQEERGSEEAGDADPLEAELSLTRDGTILGTPAYMAPEQAAGRIEAMGPHSDVYAIGAMLYQFVAGHAPYSGPAEDSSSAAVLRRVGEGPPAPLSEQGTPPALVAICARAMQRDPGQRYPDVRALSADLGAFLQGRVVKAYETGAWAEARTWVRRNRGLAGASLAALLLLVVGLATSSGLYVSAQENAKTAHLNAQQASANEEIALANARRANDERERAEKSQLAAEQQTERAKRESEKARAIQGFLEEMVAGVDPDSNPTDLRLREVVLNAAERIDVSFKDQPEVRARLHLILATSLVTLWAPDEALVHASRAVAALEQADLKDTREAADAWYTCGLAIQARSGKEAIAQADCVRGVEALRESVRIYQSLPGDNTVLVSRSEASIAYLQQLPTVSADELPDEFVRYVASAWKESDLDVVRQRLKQSIAEVSRLWADGKHQEAKDFMRKDYQAYLGNSFQRVLAAGFINFVAVAAEKKSWLPFAEANYSLAVDIVAEIDSMKSQTAITRVNLALFLRNQKRYAEAAEVYALAMDPLRASQGATNSSVLMVTRYHSDALIHLERWDEACALLERSRDEMRAAKRVKSSDLRSALVLLGKAQDAGGRFSEAARTFRDALEIPAEPNGPSAGSRESVQVFLVRALIRADKLDEAEGLLLPLWNLLEESTDKELRARCAREMAELYRKRGNIENASFFEAEAAKK